MTANDTFQTIPLDQIKPHPSLPQRRLDEGKVARLVRSIRQVGLLNPVTVTPNGNGYYLVAGGHRIEALRHAFPERTDLEVPARLVVGEDALKAHFSENRDRAALTPATLALAISTLLAKGKQPETIADELMQTPAEIRQHLALASLPPMFLTHWANGHIADSVATAMTTLDVKARDKVVRALESDIKTLETLGAMPDRLITLRQWNDRREFLWTFGKDTGRVARSADMLFNPKEHAKEIGYVEDLFDPGNSHATNIAAVQKLNLAEVEKRIAAEKEKGIEGIVGRAEVEARPLETFEYKKAVAKEAQPLERAIDKAADKIGAATRTTPAAERYEAIASDPANYALPAGARVVRYYTPADHGPGVTISPLRVLLPKKPEPAKPTKGAAAPAAGKSRTHTDTGQKKPAAETYPRGAMAIDRQVKMLAVRQAVIDMKPADLMRVALLSFVTGEQYYSGSLSLKAKTGAIQGEAIDTKAIDQAAAAGIRWNDQSITKIDGAREAWRKLAALDDKDVRDLFASTMAAALGWAPHGQEQDQMGSLATETLFGDSMCAKSTVPTPPASYFEKFSKAQLAPLAKSMGLKVDVTTMKRSDAAAAMSKHAAEKGWRPTAWTLPAPLKK